MKRFHFLDTMKKITAILLLLPWIRAADIRNDTDFMEDYTVNPERDVTKSLVTAIEIMTGKQFNVEQNRDKQLASTDSNNKDKNAKVTYDFNVDNIFYHLTMNWEFDSITMNRGQGYSDFYYGLTLKNMKLDGTWEYREIDKYPLCKGKINVEYRDIDELLDLLSKYSMNHTVQSEIRSDLLPKIESADNCAKAAELNENLQKKSYLKIIAGVLEVIPILVSPNRDPNQIINGTKIGNSYAYFIKDDQFNSNELMIRGLHQLKKMTIQYPDYGQVTSASEFKIPIWRAKIGWFSCDNSAMPMHIDVESEYLILKGNISGEIDKMSIEFNQPETVSLNGYQKSTTEKEIKEKLEKLRDLTKEVMNQTSAHKKTMLQYNIALPLIDTLKQIIQHFNNNSLTQWSKEWNKTSSKDLSLKGFNFTIMPQFSSSKRNLTICNFYNNLKINILNHDKIIGFSNFSGPSTDREISYKNDTEKDEGFVYIVMRKTDIPVRIYKVERTDTPEAVPELISTAKTTVIITHTNADRNTTFSRSQRIKQGNHFKDMLKKAIENRVGLVANKTEQMNKICLQPFHNTTKSYPWFSPNVQHEEQQLEYYFAIDDGWVNSTSPSSELQLIDIMMKNMANLESIEVEYLPNDVLNHNLSIRNVSGNMLQVGNGTPPTELNFKIDLFHLIMNYSGSGILSEVKVQTDGFLAKLTSASSNISNSQYIQTKFENTAAIFMEAALNNRPHEHRPTFSSPSNLESENVSGIAYLNSEYNKTSDTAFSIAKILFDFHNNTEEKLSRSDVTSINSGKLESVNLINISMEYVILGIQDEMCDFGKKFKANYEDIYILSSGKIEAHENSNSTIPFFWFINSLNISRNKGDANFTIDMSFDNKMVFLNTTDIEAEEKNSMKDIIKKYMKTEIERKIIDTNRFSNLFQTCTDLYQNDIVKDKTKAQKYFYFISGSNYSQFFHLPLRINFIAIWGLNNYNFITTNKVRNGTKFQFVVKNLVARVKWSYYYNENNLTEPMQMDLHAGFISLIGKIDKNTGVLTWENESRLIFKILILPPSKKKTITVKRIMNRLNETMLFHIKKSIVDNFHSRPKPA